MKKKILALCLVVVLAITAVTGATLAYFTDADKDVNTMTVGNVSITQNETVDETTPLVPMNDVDGMKLDNKVVNVTNNSNVPVYVRTLVAFEDTNSMSNDTHFEYDEALDDCWHWVDDVVIDGIQYDIAVFVYPAAIAAGATSGDSLCGVWLDQTKVDNAWRDDLGDNGTYDILVLSQAVQAEGWTVGTTAAQALTTAFGDVASQAGAWFAAVAEDTVNS